MRSYLVEVTIQNKPLAQDPEGETIKKNLINRGGYTGVKGVRSGKYLLLQVEASSPKTAEALVTKLCNELRIFNPVVHSCTIRVDGEST